jgi:hypothetical protein
MRDAVENLTFDMSYAELVRRIGKGSADGILYSLQCIGDYQVNLLNAPLFQRLMLLLPIDCSLGGMVDNTQNLPAPVLQYAKYGIISLSRNLSVPTCGYKGRINIDGQVISGKLARELYLNILTITAGKI